MASLQGLWAQVTGNAGAQVTAALERLIGPGWFDGYQLGRALEDLERKKCFDDDAGLLALANHADTMPIHTLLRARPPAQLLKALAPAVLDPEPLRAEARSIVRSVFQQAVLRAPKDVPAEARALADTMLAECGHGLPEATWSSPFAAPKPKKKKTAVPELPKRAEAFHDRRTDATLDPTPGGAVDQEARARWRPGENVVNLASHLLDMARSTALGLWKSTPPSKMYVWGDELERLVPWLGLEALEQSLAVVRAHPGGLKSLAALDSARVAPLMALHLGGKAERHDVAKAWFARFPETAAIGLVPELLGGGKAEAAKANAALQHLKRHHPQALAAGLAAYDAPVREQVDERLAVPAELPARKPALPDFLDPAGLPRPVTANGKAVVGDALADVVCLLKAAPLDGAPWIDALKSDFTDASLARLALALYEAWLGGGAPPKERWMLYALAFFPNDAIAQQLADTAAAIAPKGLSSRAQEMVEVLAAMRTRTSLKLVHQLGRRVRSKAFRARAEQIFVTAADKMGLTEDELAERLVPDYGLSPEGVLPVAPRTVLTLAKGKAVFIGEDGKPLKALPTAADEELLELKKKATALMKETADRLERRMVNARRMPLEHFTETTLMHGLARRVAETLVWGVYDGDTLERAFTFSDVGTVAPGKTVGVVHPLELDAAQRKSFAAKLGPQAFPQLERENRPVANVDALRTQVAKYAERTVPVGEVLKLDRLGWARGEQVGGGCYVSYLRSLPTGRVEISFTPGIYLGDPMMNADQAIEAIDVQLSDPTPPILLSEVEHQLRTLFGS